MSPLPDPDDQPPADGEPTEEERRRRRAQVFGDVLPDSTRDERDETGTEPREVGDEWFRRQVPPHHG